MKGAELTPSSPYLRRIGAYLNERFPPLGNMLLIVSYYSSNQFLADALAHPDQPMRYGPHSLAGGLVMLAMFFHLRVFDEHKDFEDDCRFHPGRVLQRGIVTLRQLRALGALAIGLELGLSLWRGPAALLAVLAAQAFSLLMLKEFFVRDWLRRHFLAYAVSHMLIMPLYALVVFSFTTRRWFWEAPPLYVLYAFVGFFVTFNWEVSRKIRAPEEEQQGLDTYSSLFGPYAAAWAVLGIRVVDTAMVAVVGAALGFSPWFFGYLVALFLVCAVGVLQFRFRTSPATAKRLERYAGIYIVAFDLALAVQIAVQRGIEGWP